MLDLIFAGLFISARIPLLVSSCARLLTLSTSGLCSSGKLLRNGDAGRRNNSESGSKASVCDLFESGEPGVLTLPGGGSDGGERIAPIVWREEILAVEAFWGLGS